MRERGMKRERCNGEREGERGREGGKLLWARVILIPASLTHFQAIIYILPCTGMAERGRLFRKSHQSSLSF